MTRQPIVLLAVGLAAALIPACARPQLEGPPTIRLGRDECAGCGMLVSEERCSCAILIEQDGRRTHLVFDDLGCLLDYRSDKPQTVVVDTFTHDYRTMKWVPADAARFLLADPDKVVTPMGSGIVAFGNEAGAIEQQKTTGGEIAKYDRLAETRRGWREARRVQPAGAP